MIRSVKNFLIGSTVALGLAGAARADDKDLTVPPGFFDSDKQAPARSNTASVNSTTGNSGSGTLDQAYFGLYSRDGRDYARVRAGADTDSVFTDVSARVMERLGDSPIILGGSGSFAYGENDLGHGDKYKLTHEDIRLDAALRLGSGNRTFPQNGIVPYASIGMTRDQRDGDAAIALESYLAPRAGALVFLGPFQLQAEGGMLLDLGGKTNIRSNGQRLDYSGHGYQGRIQLSLDTYHGQTWGLAFQGGLSLDDLTQELEGMRNGQRATQTVNTREIGGELRAILYRMDGRGFISPFVQVNDGRRKTDFSFQPGDSDNRLLVKAGVSGQWRFLRLGDNWYAFAEASAAYVHDSAADNKNGYEVIGGIGIGHRDTPSGNK